MKTIAAAAAANLRKADRCAVKYQTSRVQHLVDRAQALDLLPDTRHACYPLSWLVTTGRMSTTTLDALLAKTPREMAEKALLIASSMASVRACADAWIDFANKAS